MRTITLEEHFISPGFLAGPGKGFAEQLRSRGPRGERMYEQLQDIGDKRIAEMDAAGIDMQVLSLNSPGVEQAEAAEQLSIAVESNDFLAEAVKKYPSRFAAFAALPVAAPDRAAEELDRRRRLGPLVGVDFEELDQLLGCGGVVHPLPHQPENFVVRKH